MTKPIRVLVVDDSAFRRQTIQSILESDTSIAVIGIAKNGEEAIKKVGKLKPDVITMDLNMPKMNGLEAIEMIMEDNPTPILVVSSMDIKVVIKSLSVGAMDFISIEQDLDDIAEELIDKVRIASRVHPLRRMKKYRHMLETRLKKSEKKQTVPSGRRKPISKIIAIGVSTGGPQALNIILSKFPAKFPAGILIVQHMSNGFIQGLAEWLDYLSPLEVRVAKPGDILKSGTALIAPDDFDINISPDAVISLKKNKDIDALHIPSVDKMMQSVAHSFGEDAIAVIMTGMGKDGVKGIGEVKKCGGKTIAQDEKSSVVYGMNKVAVDMGHINKTVALEKIVDELIEMVSY